MRPNSGRSEGDDDEDRGGLGPWGALKKEAYRRGTTRVVRERRSSDCDCDYVK